MTSKCKNDARGIWSRPLKGWEIFGVCSIAAIAICAACGTYSFNEEENIVQQEAGNASDAVELVDWKPRVEAGIASTTIKWDEAYEAMKSQTNADLRKIASGIDAKSLAEEVVGWTSKFQLVGGSESYRRWLDSRFRDLLLDPNDLKLVVRRRLEQLHEKLASIDNELFIAIEADIDTDFTRVSLPPIDLSTMERDFNLAISQAEKAAWASVAEFVASTGTSWVAGEAMSSLFKSISEQDANGNPTAESNFVANVLGFGAGLMAEMIVSDTANVQGQLEEKLEAAASSAVSRILVGNSGSVCWVKPLEKLKEHHRSQCLNAISSKFGKY